MIAAAATASGTGKEEQPGVRDLFPEQRDAAAWSQEFPVGTGYGRVYFASAGLMISRPNDFEDFCSQSAPPNPTFQENGRNLRIYIYILRTCVQPNLTPWKLCTK